MSEAELRERIEWVLEEWRDTMSGDDKAAAVVRGMSHEIRTQFQDSEDWQRYSA